MVVAACGVSLTPETPSAVKRQEGRVEVGRFTTAAEGWKGNRVLIRRMIVKKHSEPSCGTESRNLLWNHSA